MTQAPPPGEPSGWRWFGRDEQVAAGDVALARCVGSVNGFLSDYWSRAPLLTGEPGTAFDDLLSLDAVDQLLTDRQVRLPALRLVSGGSPVLDAGLARSMRLGQSSVDDVVDPSKVLAQIRDGATMVLQGLQHWWPPLQEFCAALSARLSHRVQANAYITPPRSAGLARHYDTHDVIMIQVVGSKSWVVERPVFREPLAHQAWSQLGAGKLLPPSEILVDTELVAGQCLYLPRGFVHSGSAQKSMSAHITIGINASTWESASRQVVTNRAETELALRQALPPGYCSGLDMPPESNRSVAVTEAEILAAAAEGFWRSYRSPSRGRLLGLAQLEALTIDTTVHRRKGVVARGRLQGDRYLLCIEDREIDAPAYISREIELLLDGGPVRPIDLAGGLDREGTMVLVRRLVAEGLLEPV